MPVNEEKEKDSYRLQHYMAKAGVASRRASEQIILAGRVSVNGLTVTELGTKVGRKDKVCVDGKEIALGRVNYVLRAAVLPAGEHTVTMYFIPGILRLEWLSILFAILTLVISLAAITWPLWNKYCKKNKELLS